MPVGHTMHESADVWFVNVLYVPALQFTNVVDANGQYWPATHIRHAASDVWFTRGLNDPGAQLVISPLVHHEPAGHMTHAAKAV